MGNSTQWSLGQVLASVALLGMGLGCATPAPLSDPESGYHYFGSPHAGDAWSRKIEAWQHRQAAGNRQADARPA